jgi:hypothetical protein
MLRAPLPPDGSTIRVAEGDPSALSLHWLPPKASPGASLGRGGLAAFLLVWLCGWAFGEVTTLRQLLFQPATANQSFMLVWVTGWSVGGVMAMAVLVRTLLPATASSLRLTGEALSYREGRMPLTLPSRRAMADANLTSLASVFRRRAARVEIPRADARNPKLERVDGVLRLTVDRGADRITIGPGLREPELEWLHGILRDWVAERASPRAPSAL